MSNVIFMDDRSSRNILRSRTGTIRDRRYAIRYPFAADAEMIDLSSGARIEGVTSDISPGGCFVCTSRPMGLDVRARIVLKRKEEVFEAFAKVRVVKLRIGMGVEFIDVDAPFDKVLARWLEQLRNER
jgi:hypothetical protein